MGMQTYISILRGINVGGKNKIKMDALKNVFTGLGFSQVQTYIQSGNVIFRSPELNTEELENRIQKQLKTEFGAEIPMFVFGLSEFKNIILQNPFSGEKSKDPAFFHVSFLHNRPDTSAKEKIKAKQQDGEDVVIGKEAVYLYCPKGYGKTKLTNTYLEKIVKVSATTRNWKTSLKLLELAEKIESGH